MVVYATMSTVKPLFASLRIHGRALLAAAEDPAAEVLALVWGPRFDREHARELLAPHAQDQAELTHALAQAADTFDGLTPPRQQRLRQLIRQHAGGTMGA